MPNKTNLRRRANKKQISKAPEDTLKVHHQPKLNSSLTGGSKSRKEAKNITTNSWRNILLSFLVVSSVGSILFLSSSDKQSTSSSEEDAQTVKSSKYNDILKPSVPDWNTSDPILQRTDYFLKNYVCTENSTNSYCHPLLESVPQRRTHRIAQTESDHLVEYKETVMVLPRHLLIWDLDAMRDLWIRHHLFQARHMNTGNTLDSGAFLAAFLLRKKLLASGVWLEEKKDREEGSSSKEESLLEYLDALPSFRDLQDMNGKHSHPTLWPEDTVVALFGKLTPTSILVKGYRNMMHSEYVAFCEVSSEFQTYLTVEDYITMRLHVISRSFGPGPARNEEEMVGVHDTHALPEEIELYKKEAGVDLSKGCRAMSPILDTWDHHAKPNVDWKYSHRKRAFIISVVEKKGLQAMQDIIVSYGKYSDTHLFTKFGFVNGDGSGHTEASIAIMHPLRNIGMGQQFSYLIEGENGAYTPSEFDREAQKKALINYLRYDDGYEECITKEGDPEGYMLKLLKLRHLQLIANIYDRWTYTVAPRNEESKPSASSDIPIITDAAKFDPKNVKFDGSKIISTCRLIALNTEDYDGKAIEVLTKKLKNGDEFLIEKQSEQLEFRALMVLSRLTTGALHLYPSTVQKDIASIPSLKFQSKEWTAAQVRLGEMQSLEMLRSIATSGSKQMRNRAQENISSSHPSLKIHQTPCPAKNAVDLLKDTSYAF